MANSYHQVYLQIVFATKFRNAILSKHWRSSVFAVIGKVINETGCKTIKVNGVEDHVHCLLSLKPSISVSDLLKTIKSRSSKYINDHLLTTTKFEWQSGYGVFSYSRSQLDFVYKYIHNQEEHHRQTTFRNEYIDLLKEFSIDYDEQFLFHQPE